MSRESGNWLMAYREYVSESESPESYHLFCALSALSSAVRRNVWLNQGIYLLYPNIFVVLVGPPGRCGKSTAIRLARRLLYDVPGVKIGPDSVTREELIREMAGAYIDGQSALTIHSTELSSLIEPSGIKMIQFLTDIFDCDYANPKGWRYSTKGQGKDEIKSPYLSLLAATTPAYIADGLPESIVSHGFTARCIFVYEEKERFLNAFPKDPPKELVDALSEDLIHISQLRGEFIWTNEGREAYEEYYQGLYQTEPDDYRVEGYHWRKRIHILKTAMLCSLAEKDDLILTRKDIDAAAEILSVVEPKMARTFTAVGKFEHALDLERMQDQIAEAGPGGMAEGELLRRNYYVGSLRILQEMLASLVAMGAIERERRGEEWWITTKRKGKLWEK